MLRLSSACALTAALLAGCGTDSEPTSPSPIGKGDGFGSAGLVLINEIAPNPDLDVNGDGSIDVGDEYIEVVNSGQQPMDLTGVAIRDAVGVRFQFPDGATLSANSAAVVIARRKNFDPPAGVDVYEAGVLGLNNTNDTVQLLRNGSVEENHGYNQGDSQDTWQRMPDGHPGGVFFPRAPTPGLRSDGTEFGANLLSDDSSRKVLDSLHDECPDTFCGGDFSYHFDVPTGATLTCAGDGTCTISGQATPFQGERWVPGSVSALSEADKVSVASNGSVRARLTGETERDSSVHDGEVLVDFACELSGDFFSARAVVDDNDPTDEFRDLFLDCVDELEDLFGNVAIEEGHLSRVEETRLLAALDDECPDTFCGGDFTYFLTGAQGAMDCKDEVCAIEYTAFPFDGAFPADPLAGLATTEASGSEFVVKAIASGTNADSEVFVRMRCEVDATLLIAEDIYDLEQNEATDGFRSTFLDCVGDAESSILSDISVQ